MTVDTTRPVIETTTHYKKHLVVFVHGFFTFPRVWNYSSKLLQKKLGPSALMYVSTANHHLFNGTEDGIDQAGIRLAKEVIEVVSKHKTLEEISFVGMSMGGLISRYAIGMLYREEDSTIAGLRPISYFSFATPHLGTRGQVSWIAENALSYIPHVRGSCDQFFMRDIQNESQCPLLVEMTLPGLKFYKGLALFKKRVLYGNVEVDHRTSYQSGVIWPYHYKRTYKSHSQYPSVVLHEEVVLPTPGGEGYDPRFEAHSEEWQAAHNFATMKFIRYGCDLKGWFASWLNHSNVIVAFESINSIGKDIVAHFVDTYQDL